MAYAESDQFRVKMTLSKDPIKAEETRRKMREASKKRWGNPAEHMKRSEAAKKQFEDPEVRKKNSEVMKKYIQDHPEVLKKMSERMKKQFENPEFYQKYADGHNKALKNPEYLKHQSEAQKKKYENPDVRKLHSERQKKILRTPEIRKKMSESAKKFFANPEASKEHRERQKKVMSSPEVRAKLSESGKKYFENPDARARQCEIQKKIKSDPEYRKRASEIMKNRLCEYSWYGNVKYYDGPQYCEKWTPELRERVRAYFGYVCVECGTPQTDRKLAIHHVWYNKKLCCDDTPRTLVALCTGCHSKTSNGDRDAWSEHFQEIIDAYYGGRCWFTREEMKQYKSGQ